LKDRDTLDNIKMDLEEIGLEVWTGFEYRSEQVSSGCLSYHSNESLDFVSEGGHLLIGVLSVGFCRWVMVPESISR